MSKIQDRNLRLRGNTWYFRKKHDGVMIRRSLGTSDKAVARDLRDAYLNNLIQFNQLDPPVEFDRSITFGQVAKMWASIHKKEVKYPTWRDYVSKMNAHILPAFKDRPINDISYMEVLTFRNSLNVKAKSANNIMVPMKSVFSMAEREGLVQQNVMKKIKKMKEDEPEIQPFSYEQIQRILEAIDPWYRPYVQVGFFTGMRAGELNGLQWDDFLEDMVNGPQISIKRTYVYGRDGEPKTKKSKRIITCLPEVIEALKAQRKLTGDRINIFFTKDGARMSPDHFRTVAWTPALIKAGIDYRPPIQIRHSFATMMLSAGEDVGWVQKMMGHTSLQMLFQRYYAWIPQKTRSDGKAFREFIDGKMPDQKEYAAAEYVKKVDERGPKIVPLADFRYKKSRLKTG